MGATGYMAIFVVLCTYIGANVYCHLLVKIDENILSRLVPLVDKAPLPLRIRLLLSL